MNNGMPPDSAAPKPGVLFKNISGEIIPPYGCVQFVPVDAEFVGQTTTSLVTYFACSKFDSTETGPVGFNGPAPCPVDAFPTIQLARSRPIAARLNPDINLEEAWFQGLSPVHGQWYLDVGGDFDFGGVFPTFPYTPFGFVLEKLSAAIMVEIVSDYYPDQSYTDEQKVAVYRAAYPDGFSVRNLTGDLALTGDPFTVLTHTLYGVHYTGNKIWIQKHGGNWEAQTTGAYNWLRATTLGSGSTVPVRLFSEFAPFPGTGQIGPVVDATCFEGSVEADTIVGVLFDDQAQTFFIVPVTCSEGY